MPVVIYESTVYSGATEEVCVPILERESGLRFNAAEPEQASAAGTAPNGSTPETKSAGSPRSPR